MKYKIKVIAHSIKNNKIAKYGEVVDESQLTGPAYELVKQGFIEEVEELEPSDLEVKAKEVKPEAPAKKGAKK